MFTKIFVCSLAIGGIAELAAMLDRGHARALDSLVQIPVCQGREDVHCRGMNSTDKASTIHFFAMPGTH